MVGVVCDFLSWKGHWLQESYYMSLKNIFNDVKIIKNSNDLNDIDLLFICDEHFQYNKNVWMNDLFINKCNEKNINVIIFNNEKIYNSYFPWNEDIQRNVNLFKYKMQFVYDVEDAKILGADINRTYMSKNYINTITINPKKIDKLVFIGNYKNNTYNRRKKLLEELTNIIDVDIIESNPNRTMSEYLNTINNYKYILSPLGNGDFVPMRYYESLFVGSIPVQQLTYNMDEFFINEKKKHNIIFFKDASDIKLEYYENNMQNYFMEDFMLFILQKNKII